MFLNTWRAETYLENTRSEPNEEDQFNHLSENSENIVNIKQEINEVHPTSLRYLLLTPTQTEQNEKQMLISKQRK